MELARSLGVRTAEEFREAAVDGRLRDGPGIGPKIEARLLDALAREDEPAAAAGLLLNRAWELRRRDRQRAGRRGRRRRAPLARLVRTAGGGRAPQPIPARVLDRFRGAASDRRGDRREERRAVGVTVEGVPVELVAAEPERFGTAAGARHRLAAYVDGARAAPGRAR